jgi:iduronate 2-sulfatase
MKQNHWIFILLWALVSCTGNKTTGGNASPPNVLFIIIDDMNVDIHCYGGPIISPNIDRLAEGGILFSNAYVQQPVCAASRASFLTGLRPNTTGTDYPYSCYFVDELLPARGTISRFFKTNGYDVKQFGKVHHGREDENPTFHPQWKGPYYTGSINESVKNGGGKPPYEKTFRGDSEFRDFKIADSVSSAIKASIHSSEPFFFVAGFHKPHLVFAAPEKYWDLYDEGEIPLPVPKTLAEGSPAFAVDQYYLNQYEWETDDPLIPFSDDYARLIRHAYYASSSFVDAQVGMVLDALSESGLEEETIVLFISDHGFLMGEQNYWGKTNLFEKGLKVPLIVSWKGHIEPGLKTSALVEAVDLFPSLAELAGLEIPDYLEGTSFKPVINNPGTPWKKGAISQQPRGLIADTEGISLRTDRYRYTEWISAFNGEILAQELFDYEVDPTESVNLATLPENAALLQTLSAQLNAGWKALLPEGVTNTADNPVAPPSYAWGPEGVSRRAAWHAKFGGSEDEGWRKSTERRLEYQKQHQYTGL